MTCLAAAVAGAVGCGGSSAAPASALCTQGRDPMVKALRAAPAPVRLADGTRLSECVTRSQDEGTLQSFGVVVTRLADDLADRAAREPAVAIELGYLIGAVRRGAAATNGVSLELAHRLESTVRRMGGEAPAAAAALQRGLRAGERTG